MKNFILEFEKIKPEDCWLFPLPQSNQYQKINRLTLPENAQQATSNQGTLLSIFSAKQTTQVKFRYQGKEQNFDWQQLEFKKFKTSPYFNNDQYINHHDKQMQKLAKSWLDNETDPKKIVRILYEQTLAYLRYGNAIRDLHPYSQALNEKITDCGGFATFLATLLQTQNLPSRLVVGYLLKNRLQEKLKLKHTWQNISMHAWLEVQLADDNWLPLDPAVDWRYRHQESQRQANLKMIPADRLILSYGQEQELTWRKKKYQWPILQHPEIIENNV